MNATTIMQRDARSGSFEAANLQTTGKRAVLYGYIMQALREDGPLTDEQLRITVESFGLKTTPSGVRSRRNELVLAGWVTEERDADGAPIKRRGMSGSPCQVWRAVAPGEEHEPPKPTRKPTGPTLGDTASAEHQTGLAVARRWAAWHIGGSGDWADQIIHAYLNPAEAAAELDEDGAA